MIYTIYEIIQPDFMKEMVYEDYGYKTIYKNVLQKLDLKNIESEHSTFDLAVSEINKNLETLKYLSLTIIPVFTIGYDATLNTKK